MLIPIRELAERNRTYRKILLEGDHTEITVMKVTKDIPLEIHEDRDQFLYIVSGKVEVSFYSPSGEIEEKIIVDEDEAIFVPSFTYHYVKKISREPVKLFSVYSF